VNEVVNEAVNEYELLKVDSCISLKERLVKDVESESTSIFSSKEKFVPPLDEGLNESHCSH
jgi:hypothetical protein